MKTVCPSPRKNLKRMGYHLYGDLQLAPPPPAFRSCLKQMEKVLTFVVGAKVVLTIPLPKYVPSACCKDTGQLSNRLSSEFATEFSGAEKSLSEAAEAGERTRNAWLINILSFFGSGESSPRICLLWTGPSSGLATGSTSPQMPVGSPPESLWLT